MYPNCQLFLKLGQSWNIYLLEYDPAIYKLWPELEHLMVWNTDETGFEDGPTQHFFLSPRPALSLLQPLQVQNQAWRRQRSSENNRHLSLCLLQNMPKDSTAAVGGFWWRVEQLQTNSFTWRKRVIPLVSAPTQEIGDESKLVSLFSHVSCFLVCYFFKGSSQDWNARQCCTQWQRSIGTLWMLFHASIVCKSFNLKLFLFYIISPLVFKLANSDNM